MAGDGPDWQQPATIASGQVQTLGASGAGGAGVVNTAADQSWTNLAPTEGKNVIQHIIINRGAVDLDVAYGAASTTVRHTLKPGESVTPPFNGTVRVRSSTPAVGKVEHATMEV